MSDLISRDDAIRELSGACSTWEDDAKVQEIVMAIPSAKPTGDLISRADAIEALNRSSIYAWSTEQDLIAHSWAIRILQSLPSAETLQGWIPCSDRLPNNDGCVLVTIDDGIEFGKYEDGSWSIWVCEHWDKWDAKGTIAWMPLPTPYKGGEDK